MYNKSINSDNSTTVYSLCIELIDRPIKAISLLLRDMRLIGKKLMFMLLILNFSSFPRIKLLNLLFSVKLNEISFACFSEITFFCYFWHFW